MDTKGQDRKQRDQSLARKRPLLEWLCWLAHCWGADLLLTVGAVLISAGVGWIYPPAGLIAGGALLIAGGVLWARGGDRP